MSATCPTCGQPLPEEPQAVEAVAESDVFRALLTDGERERGVRRIFELSPARQAEVKAALKGKV